MYLGEDLTRGTDQFGRDPRIRSNSGYSRSLRSFESVRSVLFDPAVIRRIRPILHDSEWMCV